MSFINYDSEQTAERIAKLGHRTVIRGMWEELGQLQMDFLRSRGLSPDMRYCLARLAPRVRAGGSFYVTFFECHSGEGLTGPLKQSPGNIVTYPTRDPYHYRVEDFEYCTREIPWELEYIGDWDHPHGQRMAAFHRLDD